MTIPREVALQAIPFGTKLLKFTVDSAESLPLKRRSHARVNNTAACQFHTKLAREKLK